MRAVGHECAIVICEAMSCLHYLQLMALLLYSTLNKITQFGLVESSTINPKLYSVGVPIKFPWKRRNFIECIV